MFIRQRIPRAFPIPSKRSGCRPYLATLHTLPEIGSWEQCLVTEEDLRIISQAGFRLAAPLWNQIQDLWKILDVRQVSYRKDGRTRGEELGVSRMRRSSEWDGHDCERKKASIPVRKGEKRTEG